MENNNIDLTKVLQEVLRLSDADMAVIEKKKNYPVPLHQVYEAMVLLTNILAEPVEQAKRIEGQMDILEADPEVVAMFGHVVALYTANLNHTNNSEIAFNTTTQQMDSIRTLIG